MTQKIFTADDNKIAEVPNRVNKTVKNSSKSKSLKNKKSRNLIYKQDIKAKKKSIFPTSGAKKDFNHL